MPWIKQSIAAVGAVLAVALFSQTASAVLVNPDFETGDLTGWTSFTTPAGSIDFPGDCCAFPEVQNFETVSGVNSLAAAFNVGRSTSGSSREGGGIFQSVNVGPGTMFVSVDIAVNTFGSSNIHAGLFELLIDNVVVDSHDFGSIGSSTTERNSLMGNAAVAGGSHEVRVRISRGFFNSDVTPIQYLDNFGFDFIGDSTRVAEPATLAMFSLGVFGLGLARRRRRG